MKNNKNLKYFCFYFGELNNSLGPSSRVGEIAREIENILPKIIIYTFGMSTAWMIVKEVALKLR